MINFKEDAYFDDEMKVYRWKSNHHIPFDDMLKENGISEQIRRRCAAIRAKETTAFLNQYVNDQFKFWNDPEHEEARKERMNEMRAVYGKGVEIINCITGHKVKV